MAKSSGIGGILITLLVLGGAGYGGYYFYSKKGSQEIEYSTVAVRKASVRQSITATGALQTVRQVDVSTIKVLAKQWYGGRGDAPAKPSTHTALDDIRASVAELKWYRDHCFVMVPN